MMRKILLVCTMLVFVISSYATAAITEQEAAKLGGPELTPIGAEKAGNKAGTIPAWTGGITKGADGWYYEGKLKVPFSAYDPKKGKYPDPFADDKVLFKIDSKNMAQYADKLTPGQMALMQKYPEYHLNVYPTRRGMSYPQYIYDNTKKVATTAKLEKGGNQLVNAHAGYAFPIPKSGLEVVWNHLLTPNRGDEHCFYESVQVTSAGRVIMTSNEDNIMYFSYWDPQAKGAIADRQYYTRGTTKGPANRNGEKLFCYWSMDKTGTDPSCWQYLPGQRRVKQAPEISFDGPNVWVGGAATYDSGYGYMGSPERYTWKLIGKKEMYIPVNNYKFMYYSTKEQAFGPHTIKPEVLRWELHRVWMVEGNLKPEYRHIYKKRTLYMDEDNWYSPMSDLYDANGKLWRTLIVGNPFAYPVQASHNISDCGYDLVTGQYYAQAWTGEPYLYSKWGERAPADELTPSYIGASGVR